MSLFYGVIAGFAYGLSSFGGGLLAWPLLVLGVGLEAHAALAVALATVALCAAIAAGDAARARQCEPVVAALFALGAVPAVIVGPWLAQLLTARRLAMLAGVVALVIGGLLLIATRPGNARAALPAPVAMWRAPRRGFHEAAASFRLAWSGRLAIAVAGALSGLSAGLCGAPPQRAAQHLVVRRLSGQPFLVVGTLAFGVTALAAVGAAASFALAPAAPGYTAGLFVLGAVAGMGFARRIDHPRMPVWADRVVGAALVFGAAALFLAVIAGGLDGP